MTALDNNDSEYRRVAINARKNIRELVAQYAHPSSDKEENALVDALTDVVMDAVEEEDRAMENRRRERATTVQMLEIVDVVKRNGFRLIGFLLFAFCVAIALTTCKVLDSDACVKMTCAILAGVDVVWTTYVLISFVLGGHSVKTNWFSVGRSSRSKE